MLRIFCSLLFAALVVSCGSDAADSTNAVEDAAETTVPTETNEDRLSQVAPPPPICTYLTEAEVLALFEAGVRVPMPGQRSPGSFHSCQYNLEADGWAAALVVEMPEDLTKIQSIKDEVSGAKGKDKLSILNFPARIMNDGRIISVEAKKPFRVKFSALPTAGQEAPFDEAARRELIVKMAQGVME